MLNISHLSFRRCKFNGD